MVSVLRQSQIPESSLANVNLPNPLSICPRERQPFQVGCRLAGVYLSLPGVEISVGRFQLVVFSRPFLEDHRLRPIFKKHGVCPHDVKPVDPQL